MSWLFLALTVAWDLPTLEFLVSCVDHLHKTERVRCAGKAAYLSLASDNGNGKGQGHLDLSRTDLLVGPRYTTVVYVRMPIRCRQFIAYFPKLPQVHQTVAEF